MIERLRQQLQTLEDLTRNMRAIASDAEKIRNAIQMDPTGNVPLGDWHRKWVRDASDHLDRVGRTLIKP